jgi:uncharacterized protein (DUF488 family)
MIYTIGHSTRGIDEFLGLLGQHRIATLADVRRYPASRRYPHFSRDALHERLEAIEIEYLHLPELGGRRSPTTDSPNTAWRNEQFRGYADHLATAEFQSGLERLLGAKSPVAVVCAEAVPWRCHRQMIADELVRRGLEVTHILDDQSTLPHKRNPNAIDAGTHLIYPATSTKTLF